MYKKNNYRMFCAKKECACVATYKVNFLMKNSFPIFQDEKYYEIPIKGPQADGSQRGRGYRDEQNG